MNTQAGTKDGQTGTVGRTDSDMTNGFVGTAQRAVVVAALLIVVGTGAYVIGRHAPALALAAGTPSKPDVSAAIRFLKREPLGFLVTERVVTQVVTEAHEGNFFTGYGNGLLVGKIELLYGVDLTKIDLDSVTLRDNVIHVRVPEPELLRYVPDLASLRFIEKKTALLVILDRARGEDMYDKCLAELERAAREFAEGNELAPKRADLVERLNGYAPVIAGRISADIVFE